MLSSLAAFATGVLFSTNVAASIYAVGRVKSVDSNRKVYVRRRNGGREVVEWGMLLFGGDVFEFEAEGEVKASVYGVDLTYSHKDPVREIPLRGVGPIDPADEQYFDQFSEFIAEPPPLIMDFSDHRDPNKRRSNLSACALAPIGNQFFLANVQHVAIVWFGGLARLSITPAEGKTRMADSDKYEWIVIDRPKDTNQFKVEIDPTLNWSFKVVDLGIVEQISGRKLKSEYAARLRWAHETLLAPASQFRELRVLALSILAELAQPNPNINNEFARAAWWAARNRRMLKQVGTVVSR